MSLLSNPKFQPVDADGEVYSGGKLYSYHAGTSTAKATYSDADLTIENTNPVILDSSGSATVYLKGTYKLILKDSDDTTIWTIDNVEGMGRYDEFYYADSSEADQGSTGNGQSMKALLDEIGSNYATLYLTHAKGGSTSTYYLYTSLTIPSNIRLKIDPGAYIRISSSQTLTINGPLDFPYIMQCFTGDGDVSLGSNAVLEELPEWSGTTVSQNTQDTVDLVLHNHLSGLEISNSTDDSDHDIIIAAGVCADSTNTWLMEVPASTVKQIDATYVAGGNVGGLATALTLAASTEYHVFVIRRTSDAHIDVYFDTSLTAANIPSGYDYYRRIGSVFTDASSNILGFDQWEDEFLLDDPTLDVDTTNPGASAVTATLSVPTGVEVRAIFNYFYYAPNAAKMIYFSALTQNDEAPSGTAAPLGDDYTDAGTAEYRAGRREIRTNTSGQIRYRQSDTNASTIVRIATLGWIDRRGK